MQNLLNKIFNRKNKNHIYYALEGEVERKLGNYNKSLRYFNMAINKDPKNDMYYISRALSYKELGKYKEALKDINEALKINPDIEKAVSIKNELISLLK